MAQAKTAAPSKAGLTIARNSDVIVLTWTPVKDCTDQDIAIYVNNARVGAIHDLGPASKKYTYTINRNAWFPYKSSGKNKPILREVAFRLSQTQKNKTQSDFSEQKEFRIYAPGQPKYVDPVMDSTNHNTFTYSWERNGSDGDSKTSQKMFTRYDWETCLVAEGKAANWKLAKSQKITILNPSTGTPQTNQNSYGSKTIGQTSVTIVEKEQDIAARKTRYFRVRSIGPGGVSSYRVYSHHIGGYKNAISIDKSKTNYLGSNTTGTSGSIPFSFGAGWANDSIQIQYGITAPAVSVTTDRDKNVVKSSLFLPVDYNSWTTLDTFGSTGKTDKYTFKIPDRVTENTMLFMRINRIHDSITTYGYSCLMNNHIVKGKATTVIGTLTNPVLNSVSINDVARTVTVTVTDQTNIDGTFIAVYQRIKSVNSVIGIIPYGSTSGTFKIGWGDTSPPTIGIRSCIANYKPIDPNPSAITKYTISNVLMRSGIVWQSDLTAKPPEITEISKYDNTTAYISWKWTWDQADSAEISWADTPIRWDSTEDPSSYTLTNTGNGHRYITGLSAGTYYFRVRFIGTENETVVYGIYSDTVELVMSSAPSTPTLTLSDEDGIVAIDDQVTAYWQYSSNDGTPQSYAQLAEATRASDSDPWTYTPIQDLVTNTDTHISFIPSELGWEDGSTHNICVRVTSESGEKSEGWSQPVSITIADKPVILITGIGDDNDVLCPVDDPNEAYNYKLTGLPLDFTVDGFGGEGYCSVVIERASTYEITRPDDTHITGFAGETILSKVYEPEEEADGFANISIGVDDLIGRLDNTAQYNMIVTITDKYGQTDKADYQFTVMWDYFAQMPSATITIDSDNDIAIISPSAPQTIAEGDYCQIYRMSSDTPQLILDHGEFGETYVDIYPTFGRFGGYRIVYITKYGDYKTNGNLIAMTEYSKTGNDEDITQYDKFLVSIAFDNNVVEFPGNISLNNSWAKDFQTTKYLGGSIQGDWNPGVQRSGTINGTIPIEHEPETIYGLRLLADYAGICHVRTPEGSNFYGDIQVRDDREEKWVNRLSKISLTYTKVDGVEDSVMTYSEWEDGQEE